MQTLATLIAALVSGEAAEAANRARRAAIAYAIAALLALCGAGFLVGAGFGVLARRVGPIDAALWFGGGFVVAALLIFLGHRISAGFRSRRLARRRRTETKAMVGAAALALLPSLLAGRGKLALLAPAIGFLGYAIYHENRRHGAPDVNHPDER